MSRAKPTFTDEQLAYISEMNEQAVLKAVKEAELKTKQREKNSVVIGASIVSTETIVGKPIIDKDTRQQRVDTNGIPQSYPDKYKASIVFKGGSLDIDITASQFDMLQPNKTYLFEGYYGEVKKFGASIMQPIFTSITEI